MDYGLIDGPRPTASPTPGIPSFAAFEPTRHAMGDTLRYAEKIDLLDMTPRGDLTSTTYALANPGMEYLILQPTSEPFTATLMTGTYSVAWHDIASRSTTTGEHLVVSNEDSVTFAVGAPAVLHLKREGVLTRD